MAEIFPGIHQIVMDYHGRPLQLYLLIGESASLLMDTGDAGVPEREILPYFAQIGFDPGRLNYIMVTHPDVDHSGGLHRMKQACPQARYCCGMLDREQIERPEAIVRERYCAYNHWHGVGPDEEHQKALLKRAGGYVPMDFTLTGGEELRLGPEQVVRVLHLPGHSRGHLGVYVPWVEGGAAFIADAVHDTGNRFIDGRLAFAPTYMYVDEYLQTIQTLESMDLHRLYTCHWPNQTTPEEVRSWLSAAREYAERAEGAILETLREAPEGMTLREVCLRVKPRLGDWPAERDMETRFMAHGHLRRLEGFGVVMQSGGRPVVYRVEGRWEGLK